MSLEWLNVFFRGMILISFAYFAYYFQDSYLSKLSFRAWERALCLAVNFFVSAMISTSIYLSNKHYALVDLVEWQLALSFFVSFLSVSVMITIIVYLFFSKDNEATKEA